MVLGIGLRHQFQAARSTLSKCAAKLKEDDNSAPPSDEIPTQGGKPISNHLLSLYISKSMSAEQKRVRTRVLHELPPMCLRGLHLGATGINRSGLSQIAAGIRVAAHLSDLRLPSNHLTDADIELLIPLLRYYPGLQVLDLSNNDLGVRLFILFLLFTSVLAIITILFPSVITF